jgi:hypothetical protein
MLDRTDAKVVLISTWRLDPIGLLAARYFKVPYFDVTPDLPTLSRCEEIVQWLDTHPDVTRFAVLDDTNDGFDGLPFFQTDVTTGLTQAVADRLEAWFCEVQSPARNVAPSRQLDPVAANRS